jgi:hypothetical protein
LLTRLLGNGLSRTAARTLPLRPLRAAAQPQDLALKHFAEGITIQVEPVRAALTAEAFDQAREEGRATSFDDAVRYTLAGTDGHDA